MLTLIVSLLVASSGGRTISTANEQRADGEKLLRALKEAWTDHILCMNMTTDVLMYMDRVYCKGTFSPSTLSSYRSQC